MTIMEYVSLSLVVQKDQIGVRILYHVFAQTVKSILLMENAKDVAKMKSGIKENVNASLNSFKLVETV